MKKKTNDIKDLFDKKINNRHEAQWLLVAHIRYVDQLGTTIRKASIVTHRCFTQAEAHKFIRDIGTTETEKHVGFNARSQNARGSLGDWLGWRR